MSKKTRTLVIVESPAKCSKIEEMLGPAYVVRASYGHIRDIVDGLKAIDFTNQYAITYGMIDNELKRKKIAELKTLKQQCSDVLIASDPDREGEAIAYHVAVVLGLPIPSAKRIKFQEITKRAILAAVASPGIINMELVRSQEARRVLDLLVGFELSPILSRALGGNLSAGRCQSPAVRLVYDREKEIERQETTSSFTIDVVLTAETVPKVPLAHINATFKKRYLMRPDVEHVFELIQLPGTIFTIDSFNKKPIEHSPPKPYTTSTIQQDCSSLLSMNPKETMSILQKLYEAGKTTYMRTDSVILSRDAMDEIGLEIRDKYDASYHTPREYKNKGAASQEAHEAVRPTHMTEYPLQSNGKEEWSARESRVYELVWRRTMASQMTNQRIQRNSAEISMIVNSPKKIIHDDKLESVIDIEEFPGWKILYGSSSKPILDGDINESAKVSSANTTTTVEAIQSLLKNALICIQAEGAQSYARSLGRYTEASLIKDLESQGIGRPSTYANIMETIIKERKYVDVRDFPGIEKTTDTLLLKRKSAKSATLTLEVKSGKTIIGKEKNKLVISPLGYKIVEFLMKEFGSIMDYAFTKLVEEELDLIIEKKANYSSVVDKVYTTFHPHVLEMRSSSSSNRQNDDVILGTYDEHDVILKNGKFGYYLVYNGENFGIGYSTPERKHKIVEEHDIEEAVALIDSTSESRKKRETNPVIKVPPKGAFEIRLGPYGYYFTHNKKFYSIGKREPGSLTEKDCRDIIKEKYKTVDK
jgi:DNA topoisomerase-1